MLNEYRFQETWIEEQTEILKYINFCGLMFFPSWAHSLQTNPHVLKTGYLVLNSLDIFFITSLKEESFWNCWIIWLKVQEESTKNKDHRRKNSNILNKEASHCPGSAPRCSRRASASWSGKKAFHHESDAMTLQMALQTGWYYCLVLES